MLCLNLFDKQMRPTLCKCPYGSKKCDYVHKLSKLKAPDDYKQNSPLPSGTAVNLQHFECHDWGSGHADRPVLKFAFEDTFPTKATTFVKKLVAGEFKAHLPGENQAMWASVCYNFSFYGKCSYWGNCSFLHVEESAANREFSKHRCMCGTNGGICGYRKCKYPHRPAELWFPEEFVTPAFPRSSIPRGLNFYNPDTKQESTCSISEAHIASTPERNARWLCSNQWCNDEGCRLGAHLCPTAWFNGGVAFTSDAKPKMPPMFMKRYGNSARQAPVPRASAWAVPAAPRQSRAASSATPIEQTPSKPANVEIDQESNSSSSPFPSPGNISPHKASDDEFSNLGSAHQEAEDNDGSSVQEPERCSGAAESLLYSFIDLLNIPPVAASKFKENRLPKCSSDRIDDIKAKWNGGLIERYKDLYEAWFGSMQMQDTFMALGNVLTHSSLKIGEGFAAEVRLGIMPSDGREVAVKMFKAKDEADKHFTSEVEAMKKYSTIPGTVPYLTSFEYSYEDNEDSTIRYKKVVVLELMEGTLQDVVESWEQLDHNPVGTSQHLQLVRFVVGSMLQILARLNHGQRESLVHRDVKPENIMVDRNRNIRLADFGISRVIEKSKSHRTMSYSGGGIHIFGSPEAKKLKPYAHLTSDLYSMGMVLQAIATGNIILDTEMDGVNDAPATWPEHHRQSYRDLVKQLVVEDPDKRAYIDFLKALGGKTGVHLMPHDLMLSHPFFWSSRECTRFLVTLGNYGQAPFDVLHEALKTYFASLGINSWFDKVQHLEQENFPTEEHHKSKEFGLLKFMRNKYVHINDHTMSRELRTTLQDSPVFLSIFPGLVVSCWSSLLCVLDRIFEDVRHTQLQAFFLNTYDAESARRSQITEPWL